MSDARTAATESGWPLEAEAAFAAVKRAILGEDELDERELSAASGVASETIRRLWRAMGFADFDPRSELFTRADVGALLGVRNALALRGENNVLGDARVLSSLLARAADVVARSLVTEFAGHGVDVGDAGVATVLQTRVGEISALLDYVFRRQLLTELTRQLASEPGAVGAAQPMAVIFADLVGFTTLTEDLEDEALTALVARFQSVAFGVVAQHGGRVVKTLGDEVMVVCEDPDGAVAVAIALASSYSDEELLPEVRVGMAYGPVVAAQGDLFGPTVNMASRLVGVAPPGVVVVSDEVRVALGDRTSYRLVRFGPRRLKGIGWTTAWVVEPPHTVDGDTSEAAREGFYAALLDDDADELYEQAPCGYLSTTPDGTIIKVNRTFLTWTGYDRGDLVGRRRFVDLLTGGGRIYHETHYAPMLQTTGTAREIALEIVRADGARVPALVNAVLERDADGAPVVVRAAVFDATDRREYERELLRAKQRAEESEQAAVLLARTLQQSLIPPDLPSIPGLELAAAYRPAGAGEEVGGDFYDVFQVGEGEWFVVIGDVCGKGVEAAVVTALARYTIRAAAATPANGPADVLRVLNGALLRHGRGRFCTVAAACLRHAREGWNVTLASGGHPLPLLVRGGEPPEPVGPNGTLLGVVDDPDLKDGALSLHSGDQLVFFTDGVIEARRDGEFFAEDRLRSAVSRGTSATAIVESVLDQVLAFQAGSASDDIAVVVVGAS